MEITDARKISLHLTQIRALSGRNEKELFAAAHFTSPDHKEFLDMVGNNKRQWFTTWASVQAAHPTCGETWDDVWYAAESRISTPAQTASKIKGLIAEGYPENVIKAIVEKTPDIGITVASIKKSQGEIKRFSPALASDWLDMSEKKHLQILEEHDYVATPKLNGLRCLFFCNIPGMDGAMSRALKPLKNLGAHHAEILKIVGKRSLVLDGEIMSNDNTWENSITATKKTGSKVAVSHYSFDCVSGEEYTSGKFVTPARERFAVLDEIMDKLSDTLFTKVHRLPVKTIAEVEAERDLCIEEGWEGTVLHDLNSVYACKRSTSWVKVKVFKSSEFRVESFIAGTGKHKGRLGAFLISGKYKDQDITSEIGTGFSDAEREEIWNNQDAWKDAVVEIKFQNTTRDGSLLFPSYLRRRPDLEK
jgi:ATP-dependent DNA ligase